MKRQPWTAHVFNLDIDPGWIYNILTRVEDTELRLRHYCKELDDAHLSLQTNGAWSIKEHIGHLIDLEELHLNRLKEFADLKVVLTGADMSNAKTEAAAHNERAITDLLDEFSQTRKELAQAYKALPEQSLFHKAMHPRLKVLMRPVDLMYFIAEHDDHHLATIKMSF
jgi:uncharacterized damage-inducible protein DinB